MLEKDFRKELSSFKPYVQGKPIEVVAREYGLKRIEKLASNENQFGPSPLALDAMRNELGKVNFYPEGYPFELIAKLSKTHSEKYGQVDSNQIVVGNGGESLIWLISMIFLNEGDEIISPTPSFDIYNMAASYMGAKSVLIPFKKKGDTCEKPVCHFNAGYSYDIEAMLAAITDKTKILWLCSPNNPTGHIISREDIEKVMEKVPSNVAIVLDEAYYEFAQGISKTSGKSEYPDDSIKYLAKHDNVIILRTLSKIYGLAGVRVGYVLTSPIIANKMNMVKQTFGVSRLAIVAAMAALDDNEHLHMTQTNNREGVDMLERYFSSKKWEYFPSFANFVWVNIGTTGKDSQWFFSELQKLGVIIRPGCLWGFDSYIRISTGRKEQLEFFIECMDKITSVL